jgi:hypothetical protein
MRVILENKSIGKKVEMDVSDEFFENEDDIRLIAGAECYKLTSTKTREDKEREELSIDFSNDVFPRFENAGVDPNDKSIVEKIKSELNRDTYKRLREVSNENMLVSALVEAYRRYIAIHKQIKALDDKIKSTKIVDNVFFDYILRLSRLFENATTLEEAHNGLFEIKEMFDCDDRVAVGMSLRHGGGTAEFPAIPGGNHCLYRAGRFQGQPSNYPGLLFCPGQGSGDPAGL